MAKPNLNQKGIKRFFLYHSEKLILGLSVVLLATFFWMGYSTPVFNEKTPEDLTQLATRADQYIVSGANWDKINSLKARQAQDKLVETIQSDDKIDASRYIFQPSVKAQTPELRSDPTLLKPKELIAFEVKAPIILSPGSLVTDPMLDLPEVDARNLGGNDFTGFGDVGRDDREFGPTGGRPSRSNRNRVDEEPEIDMGNAVLSIHEKYFPGVRPPHFTFSPQTEKSFIMTVVAVNGLVDIKQQWKDYETSFGSGTGYYPQRDKPEYQYLEVQRMAIVDGKETEWEDISRSISRNQPRSYPQRLKIMPGAKYGSALESIAPNYYDPVLTTSIPPLTQIDYRPFVTHPKIENRKFTSLTETETRTTYDNAGIVFDQFDQAPTRDGIGPMGRDDFGFGGSGMGKLFVRGANVSEYERALEAKKPLADYKLVRFFDLQAKPGVTYRYRVRVWLKDPNNEPSEEDLASFGGATDIVGYGYGGNAMRRDSRPTGPGAAMRGPVGPSGRDERGPVGPVGRDERGPMGPGSGQRIPGFDKIEITNLMKKPIVRARLSAAREVVDPKNKLKKTYFVTEFRTAPDGTEVSEEIQVPEGHSELRFARPTEWSEPVEIAVSPNNSNVIAGNVEPARTTRVGDKEFVDGEPVTEVVPTVWSKKYRTLLPARKQAYRADALDFSADIHVLNSVTWGVHVYKNAPILTNTVLVDMLGGEELALPKDEILRHHLPSEVLVMNGDGTFDISNDLDDKTQYMNALLLPDESLEVGGERAEKQRLRELEESGRSSRGGRGGARGPVGPGGGGR